MVEIVALCLLGTLICSLCLVAVYVRACWRAVSAATQSLKSPAEQQTPTSDARYAALQAEMVELYATLEKNTTAVKRISGRQAKRDARAEATGDVPPPGASKADVMKHYGLYGKVGTDFHRRAVELEGRANGREREE